MGFLDKIFGKTNNYSNDDNQLEKMTDQELFDEIIKLKESLKDIKTRHKAINEITDMIHMIKDESYLIKLHKMDFEGDNQNRITDEVIHRITDEKVIAELILSSGGSYETIRQLGDVEVINYVAENIKEANVSNFLKKNASIRLRDKNRQITASECQHELQILYDNFRGNAVIKRAIDMKNSVNNWPDDMKAFYYYIIGDAIKYKNKFDKRQYAFYAAQVYYNPNNTSLGWVELSNSNEEKNVIPNPQKARQLHEKYPLPISFDELL